jgi:hypothetical protein
MPKTRNESVRLIDPYGRVLWTRDKNLVLTANSYLTCDLHRLDGPAMCRETGKLEEYWVDNKSYSKEDYPAAVVRYQLENVDD